MPPTVVPVRPQPQPFKALLPLPVCLFFIGSVEAQNAGPWELGNLGTAGWCGKCAIR
jgi:hypothetical protein